MQLMLLSNPLPRLAGGSIPGDTHMDGAQVAGVLLAGLGVVFAVLVMLVILIFLFGKLFEQINGRKKQKETAKVTEKAPKAAPAKQSPSPAPAAVAVPDEDADEVIAVISAVVAMMSAQDGTTYQVRSVKPAAQSLGGRAVWAMDGRRQNVAPFNMSRPQ